MVVGRGSWVVVGQVGREKGIPAHTRARGRGGGERGCGEGVGERKLLP